MTTKEVTNDELARMIQEGFLEMKEEIRSARQELHEHREESRKEHNATHFNLSETVSRVEHNQLKLRVETLETKAA